ncbi:sulfotransferase family protein [Amphritea pacifica]|uniref:Sulfotransferase n=1 Tax=Amphritea pacifica TaxID=2811233 RepID=A0ABS2WDN0_9GAMM|nr:sulfotransferase [Amphritea pacifica]MBN0989837.1 sulfotransferase [Amphritea pacifica]MBN1006605.1 sulfotransferase [Amphritea pacifica]
MNIKQIPMIIVAGCQRSGTTLTGQILGAHSKTFLIDEFDGLYQFIDSYTGKNELKNQDLDKIVSAASVKYKDVRACFRCLEDLTGYIVVAKAPNVTYDYDSLVRFSDSVKVLFPVREVFSVVASMLTLKGIPMIENQIRRISENQRLSSEFSDELKILNDTSVPAYLKAALIWNIKTGMYSRFLACGFDTFVFKYEDLVAKPFDVIRKMLEHCQLPYDASVIDYKRKMKGEGPGNTSRESDINTESLNKWKNLLNTEKQLDIMRVAYPLMTDLGYKKAYLFR